MCNVGIPPERGSVMMMTVRRKPKQKRVYWDDTDKQVLIDEAFKIRTLDPGESLSSALKKAMSFLPQEKKRTIVSLKQVEWFTRGIKEKYDELNKTGTPQIITVKEPQKDPSDIVKEMGVQDLYRHIPADKMLQLMMIHITSKFGEIADSIKSIELSLMEMATRPTQQTPKPASKPVIPANPTKQVITIIGVLPDQENRVRELLINKPIKVHFINSGRDNGVPIPASDCIFLMTRFTSHCTQIKAKNSGAKVVFVDGGMSSLTQELVKSIHS